MDEIQWLNNHLRVQIKIEPSTLKNILCFSLIWNLFEGEFCKTRASAETLKAFVETMNTKGLVTQLDFKDHLEFFRGKYLNFGEVNSNFRSLEFRSRDKCDHVIAVLKGNLNHESDIALALLLIIFRFRNNYFHGIKKFMSIAEQEENFKRANEILINCIEINKT